MSIRRYGLTRNSNLFTYAAVLLVTLFVVTILFFINGRSLIGIDDANIYLVYMRNFANGQGFVFNAGGEHIEGFTSLLWTVTGALLFHISAHPEILLLILNMVIVSYSTWRLCRYINSSFNSLSFFSSHVVLFLGLLISLPGYFEWTVLSLMDTGLWSSLLILISLNLLEFHAASEIKKANIIFSMLLILIICCRPESVLWGAFFLLIRTYQIYSRTKNVKEALIGMILPLSVYMLSLTLLISWQQSYFGYPLPNSYYAKISSDRIANLRAGMKYLTDYFQGAPFVLLIFLIFLKFPLERLRLFLVKRSVLNVLQDRTFFLFFFGGIFSITFFIPLFAGGDHFAYYRLIQPTLPLILLSLLFSLDFFQFRITRTRASLILVFVLITSSFSLFYTIRNRYSPLKNEWLLAVWDRNFSEKMNVFFDILPHYPTQGVPTSGGSAYSYKGVTIDLLGLNNAKMAHADRVKDETILKDHASFNKGVFYEQKPDLFLLYEGFVSNDKIDTFGVKTFRHLIFKGIEKDEQFHQEYSACTITRKGASESLQIFASKKFLNSLDTNSFKVIRYN